MPKISVVATLCVDQKRNRRDPSWSTWIDRSIVQSTLRYILCFSRQHRTPSKIIYIHNETCSAIVSCRINLGAEPTMINEAKLNLQATIDDHPSAIEAHRNNLYVGNHPGLTYASKAEEHNQLTDRVASLERELAIVKCDLTKFEAEAKDPHSQVLVLQEASINLRTLCSRFISVYKRDNQKADASDRKIISEGNECAQRWERCISTTPCTIGFQYLPRVIRVRPCDSIYLPRIW